MCRHRLFEVLARGVVHKVSVYFSADIYMIHVFILFDSCVCVFRKTSVFRVGTFIICGLLLEGFA